MPIAIDALTINGGQLVLPQKTEKHKVFLIIILLLRYHFANHIQIERTHTFTA